MEDEFELELDDDGYPTMGTLDTIRNFPIDNQEDCEKLLQMASQVWCCPHYFTKDEKTGCWLVNTIGWSGNEDIIGALVKNHVFWALYWRESRAGGHYIFGSFDNRLLDIQTDLKLKGELFKRNGLMNIVGGQLAYTASAFLDSLPEDIRSSLGGRSLARNVERWDEQVGMYDNFLIGLEKIDETFYREYQRRAKE